MTDQIKTNRLVLRPYRPSDAEAVATQISDFAVSKWLTTVPYPYGPDDARAFFDKVADEEMVFAVLRGGTLIGCVSIMDELGYWYGASHWGQGYATEAATAAVDVYFDHADGPLASGYLDGNEASRNVLRKLGFKPNGARESRSVSRQTMVKNHRMILTKQVWEARQ